MHEKSHVPSFFFIFHFQQHALVGCLQIQFHCDNIKQKTLIGLYGHIFYKFKISIESYIIIPRYIYVRRVACNFLHHLQFCCQFHPRLPFGNCFGMPVQFILNSSMQMTSQMSFSKLMFYSLLDSLDIYYIFIYYSLQCNIFGGH